MADPDYFQKLPDHIRQEVKLRMGDQLNPYAPYPAFLTGAVKTGIDIEAAANPSPSPREVMSDIRLSPEDGEPIIGAVYFEMKVDALGCSAIRQMRAAYLVTLITEEERERSDGEYPFGCSFIDFEVLLWEHEEDTDEDGRPLRMPAPRWRPLRELTRGVIPDAIRARVEDLITAEVLARSGAQQSEQ